jgi:translation initiation factor 2 alpha subunit (eIF-2alpha)
MSETKVEKSSDVVNDGDKVMVKVVSIDPETKKMSLSMKYVDQATGKDKVRAWRWGVYVYAFLVLVGFRIRRVTSSRVTMHGAAEAATAKAGGAVTTRSN